VLGEEERAGCRSSPRSRILRRWIRLSNWLDPDERDARDAETHLRETVTKRIREDATPDKAYSYLSGSSEGPLRNLAVGVTNVWTMARAASKRMNVVWRDEGGSPALAVQAASVTLRKKQRRNVFSTLRRAAKEERAKNLMAKADQG